MISRWEYALATAATVVVSAGSGGGEHGAAEPNVLDWKTDLALWTAVVFAVLVLVLWKLAWKPIAEGLERREKLIGDQIADAKHAQEEGRELLAAYQKKLTQAQDDVRSILDQARRDGDQVGRELLDKAKAEVKREHELAVRDIETATASAIKEIAVEGANLAVQLAGRIVRAKLAPEDHAELIRNAMTDFAKTQPGNN